MSLHSKEENLSIKLDYSQYLKPDDEESLKSVHLLQRVTNYLAAAMIFLQDNGLLLEPLTKDHIKERLLGHWGHGAPANLANLFLEGSLEKFYPKYERNVHGFTKLIKDFSWPGGFPSHVNSEIPGQIHEGGELGYALSVSFGAIMDNPDLIVTCIVGDGEAETGPTAAAWHSYKFIDPAESGAVLPILHDNGFKISEKTIYGTMDDSELSALFTGFGYKVRIVSDLENIDKDLAASMEWAYQEIRNIQKHARSSDLKPIFKPKWPMLILQTPKGWTGPRTLHGQPIEGSFRSHQVPLPHAKTDDEEFKLFDSWLKSYRIHELIDVDKVKKGASIVDAEIINQRVLDVIPNEKFRMGSRKETFANYKPLELPDIKEFMLHKGEFISSMKTIGSYAAKVIENNPKSFRIFSPDELTSNKMDDVFKVTNRNYQWSPETANKGGRVLEILSEHTCQGWMQGYTLTGRVSLFPSYETFLGIITTMMIQYAKFVKMGMATSWQQPHGSINYIETSTLWRQEHNGFSHQNPGFLNNLLNMKAYLVRVYLPPDANCFLSTLAHCLRAKNYINLMIGSKQPTPVWLSPEEAERHCIAGASVWKFASVDSGTDPDVILVGCGVEVTFEVIAAAHLLKKDVPELRVRVVNVTDLMILPNEGSHPHALDSSTFESLFTRDKPVVFNFHGYPSVIKHLLFDRPRTDRFTVLGYQEEGTTTTPFRMLTANGTSRFDVAIAAIRGAVHTGHHSLLAIRAHELISGYMHKITEHEKYIEKYGKDPKELSETPKFD
ncbi:1895_t:CDS:10 [Ambispora gerdemannii]|uniref:1895_t:CDS:1 n=1 Tax=Ambispora gerdemannii TaxID=144530 RepID=A0A9N9FT47_9GLOM|nr:1895_t:CDS:10 [Ambispora gerdemannii]